MSTIQRALNLGKTAGSPTQRLATAAGEWPLPLTERIIGALPGPRPIAMIAWSLIVLARPFVASGILLVSGREMDARSVIEVHLPHNLVLALVVLLALWGTHVLARDGSRALRAIQHVGAPAPGSPGRPIRGIDSVLGPLVIASVAVLAETASPMVPALLVATIVDVVLFVALAVPIGTWIWTYGALLVAIDRLGRHSLRLDPFPVDRGLGLLPIGSVPFNGFWLFAIAALLNFLFVARGLVGYAIGLAVLVGVLVALVVSFWRLHQQMVSAKARYVAVARQLLFEATEPFRRHRSLDTLVAQERRVAAAAVLEKRAQEVLEWPIDERIVTRTVLIATGAIAGLLARIAATQLGT